jgi:hypothetical protein
LYLIQGALGVAALVVMQATVLEGYIVGLVVLATAVAGAYRLEQVDLTHTNPAPEGAPAPMPLSARLHRFRKRPAPQPAPQDVKRKV